MPSKKTNGVSYAVAPQKDAEGTDSNLDKSSRSLCDRCALSLCGLGLVILLGSLVAGALVKPYVNSR